MHGNAFWKRSVAAVLGAAALMGVLGAGAVLAGSAAGSTGSAKAAATPRCSTSGLVVWLDTNGNGAAGSIFYNLHFTNQSGHKCTLFGFPGVSGVDIRGRRLGRPAARNTPPSPHTVTLGNGATATVVLRIIDVGVFSPSICRPVTAAGLRVFPPNAVSSKVVPFPFGACSRSGPIYLAVQPVK